MPNPASGPRSRELSYVGPLTPHLYRPSPQRPVRAKLHHLRADTQVVPHRHPWAQLAISTTGVTRLTVARGSYIVPPSRALWIPPGVEHAVTVVEDADLRTLYLYQPEGHCGPDVPAHEQPRWRECRVLEVSGLLRALVLEMDTRPDGQAELTPAERARERLLGALVLDELRRAAVMPLGVDLPRDKRLRQLCEAVLADPTRHTTLAAWARDTGASLRTVARLFRDELGTTFTRWRQQVVLAHAVARAASHQSVGQIPAELGYSPSAFSAMVRRTMGCSPRELLAGPR